MEISIVATFTIGIAASLLLGLAAHALKLSPIIGYLLAGIILGLFQNVSSNHEVIREFADIGVILMMFGIGVKFHLKELIAVWKVAVPGAIIQSTISTLGTAALLKILGWPWHTGIILGMSVSVASTVVMARVLTDTRDIHTQTGHIALGWTVVEDIMTVMVLLALPMIFSAAPMSAAAESAGTSFAVFGTALLKIILLAALLYGLSTKYGLPLFLKAIAKTRSSELFTLSVMAIALGIAVMSSKLFGVSIELGAFLAGLSVGSSDFSARASSEAIPMRDAFAVLFFVSVGMMFEAQELISHPGITIIILAVVLLLKPLAAMLTVHALGKPWKVSINVGAAFSQIGEFTFILGTVAYSLYYPGTSERLISQSAFNALIAVSIISIAANPFIYGKARKTKMQDSKDLMPSPEETPQANPNRCIIIGFGPVGRAVYGKISQNKNIEICVVELNIKTVQSLKSSKINAIYGDALRPGILERAGIAGAGFLALTVQVEDGLEIIKHAKTLNPDIKILVRRDLQWGETQEYSKDRSTVLAIGELAVADKMAEEIGRMIPKKA